MRKSFEDLQTRSIECLTQLDVDDMEVAHVEADKVLCEVLAEIGFTDLVAAYEQVPKWYA